MKPTPILVKTLIEIGSGADGATTAIRLPKNEIVPNTNNIIVAGKKHTISSK